MQVGGVGLGHEVGGVGLGHEVGGVGLWHTGRWGGGGACR